MADPSSATELSPLDQIRLAEAEITRKIVTAREQSENAVVETRVQAALLKKQAHESGTRDGQIRNKKIVSKAEEEAHTIVAYAHRMAADQALARAEAMTGAEAVRSAALATRGGFSLEVTTSSVMGVRIPHIEQRSASRSFLERSYSITGTSISIDETASAFEREIEAIIQLAETELRLTRR
jgi:phage FluMu protein gp41